MDAEVGDVGTDRWDLGLVLVGDPLLGLDVSATVGTERWQRDLDGLVDVLGGWTSGAQAVGSSRPAARLAGLTAWAALGERCRLSLARALGVFQLAFQASVVSP